MVPVAAAQAAGRDLFFRSGSRKGATYRTPATQKAGAKGWRRASGSARTRSDLYLLRIGAARAIPLADNAGIMARQFSHEDAGMDLSKIVAGQDLPNDVNVVIEIPALGQPVKYEIDKESGALMVDRFMTVAMFYPCNYGFVPHTLAEDGDPLDVLVITPVPLVPGVVVRARPVGILKMSDEAGPDSKILAVPVTKLDPQYERIKGPEDVQRELLDQITHFFGHYKEMERNKWVKVEGWSDAESARAEIMASYKRYQKSKV
jgi:inorganic pyrophosphatase